MRILIVALAFLGAALPLESAHASARPHEALSRQLDADDRACAMGNCAYAESKAMVGSWLAAPASAADRAWLLSVLAGIANARHEWTAAIDFARQSLDIDPAFQKAHFHRAVALQELGRNAEALAAYRRVASTGDDVALRRVGGCRAALIHVQLAQADKAQEVLPSGEPADPRVTTCLRSVAGEADRAQHRKLAATAYRRLTEAEPADPDLWLRSMYLFAMAGEHREATAVLAQFRQRRLPVPAGYEGMYLHTRVMVSSPSDSVPILESHVAANPDSDWAREMLAIAHLNAGTPAGAEKAYRSLLAKGGDRAATYLDGLQRSMLEQRKFAEVRALCEGADAQREILPSTRLGCGDGYFASGQCDRAIPYYRRVLDDPGAAALLPEAAFGVGRCMEEMGRPKEALAAYQLAPAAPRIAPRITIVKRKLGIE